jgi:hypothetical protein
VKIAARMRRPMPLRSCSKSNHDHIAIVAALRAGQR